jgi:1-acyl-sn-glycerol-3-phosphate acyltransferase
VALETGAPLIPAAISGTQKLWIGPGPKPRRVQLTFLCAVDPGRPADHPDAGGELIDDQLRPAIRQEYGRQLARSGVILAALATTGVGVRVLARRREQAPPRLLGIVEPLKARRRKAMRRRVERFVKRLP